MANKPSNSKSGSVKKLSVILKRKSSGASEVADWANANAELTVKLISKITSMGGAIRFGYTRDSGAYSIGLYIGDDRETFYCRPNDDLDDFLGDMLRGLEDLE